MSDPDGLTEVELLIGIPQRSEIVRLHSVPRLGETISWSTPVGEPAEKLWSEEVFTVVAVTHSPQWKQITVTAE